jgi:hypothetical protein
MGSTYSFLESEKKTWTDHNLQFDRSIRAANLKILENIKDGTDIYLTYTMSEWGGINYQHWFVTDRTHFIEFGSASVDIYIARVTINTNTRYGYSMDSKNGALVRKMGQDVRDRVRHVLGMSNYSLCLRNCEHVANYIFRGRWVSSQMDSDMGSLLNRFRSYMLGNQVRLVNTFPSCIRPHVFNYEGTNKLYSFIDDHYNATRFDYYLDSDEDTYNVLVVGPTGAGKSHLINVFFNQAICESKVSHHSVTREIYFIRGRGRVYNVQRRGFVEQNIVVADTIGLCDTDWDDEKIINLIKGRVCSNFKSIDAVYIVFRADRLLKEHVANIKNILQWLNYEKGNNSLRFQFVGTYADYLDTNKKNSLRKEATEIFGLKDTMKVFVHTREEYQSLVYTGFPPEDTLNDMTKARVVESWNSLRWLLTIPGITNRISISQNDNLCNFL